MDGISCWMNNRDSIEGNTFVHNQWAAIDVLGEASPSILRNIFYNNSAAIRFSGIAARGTYKGSESTGKPKVLDNAFDRNSAVLSRQGQNLQNQIPAAETKSRISEIKFVDAEHGDYALPADSPLRAARIGASDPLVAESPWPLQPEEKAIIPENGSYNEKGWRR